MSKATLEIVALDGGGLPGAQNTGASAATESKRYEGAVRRDGSKTAEGPEAKHSWKSVAKMFGFDHVAQQVEKLTKTLTGLPGAFDFLKGSVTGAVAQQSQKGNAAGSPASANRSSRARGSSTSATMVPANQTVLNGKFTEGPSAGAGAAAEAELAEGASAAGGALAGMARVAGPVALIFVGVVEGGKLLIGAFKGIYNAVSGISKKLTSEAERLQGYSGPLSAAEAEKQIRRELRDMSRAQEIGPDLARFERNVMRLGGLIFNIGTKLLGAVAKIANVIIGPLADLIDSVPPGFNDPFLGAMLGIGIDDKGQARKPGGRDLNANPRRLAL